jgi:Spy/CpxP family protein refolding chaperone
MTILHAAILALAVVAAPLAAAQDNAAAVADLVALQKAARSDKKALVASTLKLTDAEAKKFWPVYDAYQRDLVQLMRRRHVALEGLVARDRALSDPYAKNLVNELVSIEEQDVRAQRKLTNAALRALPPKKAARYLQLENKLRAIQDYEIAVAFPLVE